MQFYFPYQNIQVLRDYQLRADWSFFLQESQSGGR